MRNKTAQVIYGNPVTKDWENAAIVEIDAFVELDLTNIDLSNLNISDLAKKKWREVRLPNGENIEISIEFDERQKRTTINVRQGVEPVAQLFCDAMSSLIFRTLGGASVNIQIDESNPVQENH
jgi:hypothetical protein